MYNQSLNAKHIKLNGIVYTPEWIVEIILDEVGYKGEKIIEKKILDPACGDGAFLKQVLKRYLTATKNFIPKEKLVKKLENCIYGWDIDENAVKECKKNLDEIIAEYGFDKIKWKIEVTDSLKKEHSNKYNEFFDFIIGNPPYIRIQNLELFNRQYIQKNWPLTNNGSTDIYIAFFELGLNLLNKDGKLGFITPNTYAKTDAGLKLREFLKWKNIIKTLIDFEHYQIFANATTYALITILEKNNKKNVFTLKKGDDKGIIRNIGKVKMSDLDEKNWILTDEKNKKRINDIRRREFKLKDFVKIHVGLTTLADDYYIFKDPIFFEDEAEITLKNGDHYIIDKNILKPIIKASILKNSNEPQNRYIIFPYKKINDRNQIIPEEELIKMYPKTYKYFSSIKKVLLERDKGKLNPVSWYAFGRSQGLETSFGPKILTSPINLEPNFIKWDLKEYSFYAGYCIKCEDDTLLNMLLPILNSEEMKFYINTISRSYQNNYKSYSKTFLQEFGINDKEFLDYIKSRRTELQLFN